MEKYRWGLLVTHWPAHLCWYIMGRDWARFVITMKYWWGCSVIVAAFYCLDSLFSEVSVYGSLIHHSLSYHSGCHGLRNQLSLTENFWHATPRKTLLGERDIYCQSYPLRSCWIFYAVWRLLIPSSAKPASPGWSARTCSEEASKSSCSQLSASLRLLSNCSQLSASSRLLQPHPNYSNALSCWLLALSRQVAP